MGKYLVDQNRIIACYNDIVKCTDVILFESVKSRPNPILNLFLCTDLKR